MSSNIDLVIVFLLILANGVFVMSEMAIVSSRKARLQQRANQGNTKARVALELANAPNLFLPTVQIGITLIVILSGALGETSISKRVGPLLDSVPALASYSQMLATGIAVIVVTYLSLVIGELTPKRVALNNPEPIAAMVALPMRMLAKIAAPVVVLLSASTDFIVSLLGIKPSEEPDITEDEIKVLIEQGTEAGTFEAAEQDMVERVFRLGDRPASALMTPRHEILFLELEDTVEENRQKLIQCNHSRLPVCQGGLDNILGIVQISDLLSRRLEDQPLDFTSVLKRPLFVPENTRGFKVLELFKQSGTHIVFVVDEYGIIQGLVTINDILVEIVGDIPSDDDLDNPQAVQREDGSWLIDGMLPVDEFYELFEIRVSKEEQGNYNTLGGFVITHLGCIPNAADYFEWKNLRLEVMDMDGNRVDKVLVMPVEKPESEDND